MDETQEEIGRILNDGLESIRRGQETVDAFLVRFPDHVYEIRPALEAAEWLRTRGRIFDPVPDFVSNSRQRIIRQIKRERLRDPAPNPAGKKSSRAGYWEPVPLIQVATTFVVIALVALAAWSAGLALKSAIPGDLFYPVKINCEKFQLAISLTEFGDSQLQAEFTSRRLVELHRVILAQRFEHLPGAVDRLDGQLQDAFESIALIAGREPDRVKYLSNKIVTALLEERLILTVLSESSPENNQGDILNALQIAAAGISSLQNLQQP